MAEPGISDAYALRGTWPLHAPQTLHLCCGAKDYYNYCRSLTLPVAILSVTGWHGHKDIWVFSFNFYSISDPSNISRYRSVLREREKESTLLYPPPQPITIRLPVFQSQESTGEGRGITGNKAVSRESRQNEYLTSIRLHMCSMTANIYKLVLRKQEREQRSL